MKVSHFEQTPAVPVQMEGSSGCQVRWLVDEHDGAPNFAMRQFEVAPGGHTPQHFHDYEHEVFVLEGAGVVLEDGREHPLHAGDVVFVKPNEVHQFRNTGSAPLKFLCLIPNSATGKSVTVAPECGVRA
ncbi:MAG TPA: cupin domain-containing protein [Pirellulales bacterium]|jgi:quercetin dioxygenase-like cupin family protein|nr:cupin domain-containing protein [Pirellulales bacterium]